MVENQSELDTVFELCSDRHRRIVLALLAEEQRALTTDDLAKAIVNQTHQMPLEEVSGEMISRIKIALYHNHLPKVAAAGLIDFDPDRELVEPTEQFARVEPNLSELIEGDPELDIPLKL